MTEPGESERHNDWTNNEPALIPEARNQSGYECRRNGE